MPSSTTGLVLAPDAPIDLQVHTIHSDGTWTPEALLDHLVSEQFGLVAITDHDYVDTTTSLQRLALEKHMPVLVAVEMTTSWKGEMTDVLCYGFDPTNNELGALAEDVMRRQQANTREVYDKLVEDGYTLPEGDELATILATPSPQQPFALVAFLKKHGYGTGEVSAGKILRDAGVTLVTTDIALVVEATHRSGAVCLIAHPGRGDGFPNFDAAMLDELRQEIPIDGIEVYYSLHTPEQTTMFLEYAQQHDLLISSGSDSHGPDKMPIKYPAELSRRLLERVGIQVR